MKIFDCFPFFNELSLLDMRLNYLNKVVNKFVIIEGTHSHQGKLKKLYYDENKSLFKKYEYKIIHIIQDSYPKHFGDTHSAFIYDYHTRNGISKGLWKCFDSDVIMISDVDEFPDVGKFNLFNGDLTIFKHLMFYFKFNLRVKNFDYDNGDGLWPGTRMLKFELFKNIIDCVNNEFMLKTIATPIKHLDMIKSITFAYNCIIIVKHKSIKRNYRFKNNL